MPFLLVIVRTVYCCLVTFSTSWVLLIVHISTSSTLSLSVELSIFSLFLELNWSLTKFSSRLVFPLMTPFSSASPCDVPSVWYPIHYQSLHTVISLFPPNSQYISHQSHYRIYPRLWRCLVDVRKTDKVHRGAIESIFYYTKPFGLCQFVSLSAAVLFFITYLFTLFDHSFTVLQHQTNFYFSYSFSPKFISCKLL